MAKPQNQKQNEGWIASWLAPFFDALGLNGEEGMARSNAPPPPPPTAILSDRELRARGFSDVDIAAVRAMEAKRR